jgi:hypothetical protein
VWKSEERLISLKNRNKGGMLIEKPQAESLSQPKLNSKPLKNFLLKEESFNV